MNSKQFFKKILFHLHHKTITLKPEGMSRGNVLLSYDITPFFRTDDKLLDAHALYWIVEEITRQFLERGYLVDIIDLRNTSFTPKKKYAYFIDLGTNLERLAPLLNKDCVKILHIAAAHWMFQNAAEYERCLDLQKRRGATFYPGRLRTPTRDIENADCCFVGGNKFVEDTYAFANKKMVPIPLPTSHTFPFLENKDYKKARKNFIWFGGGGPVHKGLDLVLEAFADMPEYHLTIFGKAIHDKDFVQIYQRELFETPNITALDYLDFEGPEFTKIREETAGIVYPSCSEGTAGSVVLSMHAGMIPIASYESGVNVGDFGVILPHNTIEDIQSAVRSIANLSEQELHKRSKDAWEYARAYYTRERFTKEFQAFLTQLESERIL